MKTSLLYNGLLVGVSGLALMSATPTFAQVQTQRDAASAGPAQPAATVAEVVVTAQKRQENINKVAMSVQAASGDQLIKQGITDPSQLQKIVPGFSAVNTGYGTPVYTIRGVGFQDNSLASSGTVSVYQDEAPLPYAIMTTGATLDVQRVEVLKGPQGTLFGENATGGAINFIANKPTDFFTDGFDMSYGRFNTVNLDGFVGGPISDTLDFRVALSTLQSGPWQKSYTHDATLGSKDFDNGRIALLWKPTSKFRALLTLEGFEDHSQTQAAQTSALTVMGTGGLPPGYVNYPLPPKNDQAADWSSCVPTTNAALGGCGGYNKNNNLYTVSLRLDYDLGNDMSVTSLTSHEHFNRYEPQDPDGTTYEDYETLQRGALDVTYQELRLAGKFGGQGSWIVGANYEHDSTTDSFLQSISQSSENDVFGITFDDLRPASAGTVDTGAVFGNVEYPVTRTITLQGGLRYTKQNQSFAGCNLDAGDDQWATIAQILSGALSGKPAPNLGPGSCGTLSGPPTYAAGLYVGHLDQDNVSWRGGVNWQPAPRTLVYFNVSHGYKAGGYSTIGASLNSEYNPVVQEDLLAYEAGFKSSLFDRTLQLNGAVYYYDYDNKQILGSIFSPTFGHLPALVNIPKSDVVGFELSGAWQPFPGLTITPAVSYANSRIDGSFVNYGPFGQIANFSGERFPFAPVWQGDVDAHYDWPLRDNIVASVGGNLSYQDSTNSELGDFSDFNIPSYALLDLRAGVQEGPWQFQLWGRNVTNKYYWTSAYTAIDRVSRFTGMPATYGATLSYRFQ